MFHSCDARLSSPQYFAFAGAMLSGAHLLLDWTAGATGGANRRCGWRVCAEVRGLLDRIAGTDADGRNARRSLAPRHGLGGRACAALPELLPYWRGPQ